MIARIRPEPPDAKARYHPVTLRRLPNQDDGQSGFTTGHCLSERVRRNKKELEAAIPWLTIGL